MKRLETEGRTQMFNPGLEIGQVINNNTLMSIFKCSQQGGMRKSNTTNTLVIVTDYTRGIYHDKWIGGVLHYTGMGLSGDQDIHYMQNRTLSESGSNGVDVHLFEVMEPGEYTYCGRIELVSRPYTETQPDQDGRDRLVWMFPVRPVPDNDVAKPAMYVFTDMEDYKARGTNVDKEYAATLAAKKGGRRSSSAGGSGLRGKRIRHKTYGVGTITKYDGTIVTVSFTNGGVKTLNYEICIEKGLIEFV